MIPGTGSLPHLPYYLARLGLALMHGSKRSVQWGWNARPTHGDPKGEDDKLKLPRALQVR